MTTGLIQQLTTEEIEGVIAHEIAHIKHYDTLIMTLTATVASGISMIANFAMFFGGNREDNKMGKVSTILLMILAPMAAMLVQMAISRTREYAADKGGAEISGNPEAPASALEKISGRVQHTDNESAENNPATAHMFIVNPLHTRSIDNLFSTHPSTNNRIRALLEIRHLMPASKSLFSSRSIERHKGPWEKQ